ncbi:MAG: glutamine-hydrolyzing carbamoyl-phosphate synthase small subunit [Anaerolineales bacterium]
MAESRGMLALEDGTIFEGRSLAAQGEWVGEIVFETGMMGYQEVITDPSFWGQMVCFTCPHIGNVGVNPEDAESKRPHVRAVIARQLTMRPSNWRATMPLIEYLEQYGVPALDSVDTRKLTLILRERGVMRAALSSTNLDPTRLIELARNAPDMSVLQPIPLVSRAESEPWTEAAPSYWIQYVKRGLTRVDDAPLVVVIDCGVKLNILRCLVSAGARVIVVPHNASPESILALNPAGLLVANGPGDPEQAGTTIDTVRELLDRLPMLGICMGQQVLALAMGARTYKMPFGHHGDNHPVQNLQTGAIEITSQNHNYAVDPDSLAGLPLEVTHRNLYDGTIEGLQHRTLPVASVQFHPEAAPGPHDSLHILSTFVASLGPKKA